MKINDCKQGGFCCCILGGLGGHSPDALSHAMPSLSLLLLSTPAFVFSPLCIFKCTLKFLHWVFSNDCIYLQVK